MSILEKAKLSVASYLYKLEEASRPRYINDPQSNFHVNYAYSIFLDAISKLIEDPTRNDIDEAQLLTSLKVIQNKRNDTTFEDISCISDFREACIKIKEELCNESDFDLMQYSLLTQCLVFLENILEPLNKMSMLFDLRGAKYRIGVKEINKHINFCPEPSDVYDALIALQDDEEAAHYIIESDYSPSEKKDLLIYYSDKNQKNEFYSIAASNPIGLRSFCGICLISEYFSLLKNSTEESLPALLDEANLFLSIARGDDDSEEEKDSYDKISSVLEEMQSLDLENDPLAIPKYLHEIEYVSLRIYKNVQSILEKATPAERIIFERVLNRTEGQAYLEKLKKRIAEEEQEPEEQLVQQQMDTPSEESISQNDSPQEDTGLQKRTHKACDFSKYDGLFDTRGDLPNKDEYLEVLNAKFKKDGVWPVLLAFLYQHGYLSLPDIPRFVYRMTGKRVGNFSLITKIEWKNNPEDLHYLCTALHVSVPIDNMKKFFDFGKDDKRFHGKYDPTREMKDFLKINFEYTKK